jgi:alpha-N-arabinofuranosidase
MEISLEKYMTGTVAIVMDYQVKSLSGREMDECGQEDKVRLRISSDGNKYSFEYARNDGQWQHFAEHDCPLLSTEMVGGFTGAIAGMYAEGEGTADFSYFKYTEQ